MELWFAPIGDTGVIAPVRVMIPTMIGTFEIKADRFETVMRQPAEATAPPANAPSR